MKSLWIRLKSILYPEPLLLANGKAVKRPFRMTLLVSVIMLVPVLISMDVTQFDLGILIRRGSKFSVVLKKMVPPNITYLPKVWEPMFQTIRMSIMSSFLVDILELPFAYYSEINMNENKILRTVFRLVMSIFRTIPVLVLALIITHLF